MRTKHTEPTESAPHVDVDAVVADVNNLFRDRSVLHVLVLAQVITRHTRDVIAGSLESSGALASLSKEDVRGVIAAALDDVARSTATVSAKIRMANLRERAAK